MIVIYVKKLIFYGNRRRQHLWANATESARRVYSWMLSTIHSGYYILLPQTTLF